MTNIDNLDMENGQISGRERENMSAIRARAMRKAPSSAHKAHTKMLDQEDVNRKMQKIEDEMRRATEKKELKEQEMKDNMAK